MTEPNSDRAVPVVATGLGSARGVWIDEVARFGGLPFAAPPVGDLRFRPPAPPAAWDGERDATGFGHVCPQNPSMLTALLGEEPETASEDCLYLNVWTTAPGDPEAALPVMVWIHGGGFEMGSGSSPMYHGEEFARSGVVLVSVNYRLGSLGFLELGHLDDRLAGSGNNGLLDQVAALEWVRDHIAAFGGDPRNVTIFGESAGAMSVSLLLTMPAAKGLFHRAIAQSGALTAARTPDQARTDADEFIATLGADSISELLCAPTEDLLAAHAAVAATRVGNPEAVIQSHGSPLAFLAFRPVADSRAVPANPLGALAEGAAAGISLICGTNLDEWKLFALMSPAAADDAALLERMALIVDDPDKALEVYRQTYPECTPGDLESFFLTDEVFRIPAVQTADAQRRHAPVFQYRFDWRSPAWGGAIGAAHAVEIPFVFHCVDDPRLGVFIGEHPPEQLARRIHDAWVAFAATGVPTIAGDVEWLALGAAESGRPVMLFNQTDDGGDELADDPESATREFWESVRSTF
ncbi:MAG: carboxylesterase/lipase family protein [Actinomycetes bacterium]